MLGNCLTRVKPIMSWLSLPLPLNRSRMRSHGFAEPRVLWSGRNALTGHKLAVCAVIYAVKQAG